ncbi:MAG: hypothetical protein LBG70_00515, partial [Bifidobacteriaceae bacterium]|nr:hypothetical protein [Bifidobacteriaceae bacterium]
KSLAADASRKKASKFVQGINDYGRIGYGGPYPPDKRHTYVITVYALKSKIKLRNGFDLTIDQFKQAVRSKALASVTIKASYAP